MTMDAHTPMLVIGIVLIAIKKSHNLVVFLIIMEEKSRLLSKFFMKMTF